MSQTQTKSQNTQTQVKINLPPDIPNSTRKVIMSIIDYVRDKMLELINNIEYYILEDYKDIVSKVLAANELDTLDIQVSYEVVYDDIIATYSANDIKEIYIEPRGFDIKIIVTLKNGIEIELFFKPQSTRKMTKEVLIKYEELVEKYSKIVDKIIKMKKEEIEKNSRISELLDKLWNHYDVKQAIRNIIEKYSISITDAEKLVTPIRYELKRLNEIIKNKEKEIEKLNEQLEILKDFIVDNELGEKFVEWYVQKRREEMDSELETEARNIIKIYEDEEYEDEDC